MDSILLKLADQLPVAVLFLIAVGYGLNKFQAFIASRDEQWQAFLKEQQAMNDKRIEARDKQRQEDRQATTDLLREIQRLAEGITEFRKDFDKAMTKMEERTRPRKGE